MRPEVALLYSGVGLDVLGRGFDQFFPSELREEIVARYPRKHFKEGFIQEYFAGFAHKPGTTYGTVNASICERLIPGYKATNSLLKNLEVCGFFSFSVRPAWWRWCGLLRRAGRFWTHSCLRRNQLRNADQVICNEIEQEARGDPRNPAMLRFTHCAVLLAPAENALDHRAAGL